MNSPADPFRFHGAGSDRRHMQSKKCTPNRNHNFQPEIPRDSRKKVEEI